MLRVALVGCGKIADAHIEEVQKLRNAKIVGVCDLEPLIAEQLAIRYAITSHYSDFTAMLREQLPDVVHITTPPASHLSLVREAVRCGAHVYIEKPFALNSTEARLLIDVVERADRKLTVNYWPNFDPPALALHTLLAEGKIGSTVHIESYLGYNLDGPFGQAILSDPKNWVHSLPGKLFQNNLDHVLNKIVPLLPPEAVTVHAMAFRRRPEVGDSTDNMLDELRVMLRAGHVSAYATLCSHASPVGHFVRIYGTKNTVQVDFNLRTVIFDGEQKVPTALGRLIPPATQSYAYFRQTVHNVREFAAARFHFFEGMRELISRFYTAIAEDTPPPIPYSEILRTAVLMDEIIGQVYPVAQPSDTPAAVGIGDSR